MVNTVVNALIAGVLGAVAFITVRALLLGAGTACCGDTLTATTTAYGNNSSTSIIGDCGSYPCVISGNITNCTYAGDEYIVNKTIWASCIECWTGAQCSMMLTILPLAVAIVTIVTLFIGLTKMRGV